MENETRTKGKRCIAMLFAIVAMFALVLPGCSQKDGLDALPEYEDDKQMIIAGWDSPINTLEDYRLAKEMGLTHVYIDEQYVGKGTQKYDEVMGFCEQVGLKAIPNIGNFADAGGKVDNTDYSKYPAVDYVTNRNRIALNKLRSLQKHIPSVIKGKIRDFMSTFCPITGLRIYRIPSTWINIAETFFRRLKEENFYQPMYILFWRKMEITMCRRLGLLA